MVIVRNVNIKQCCTLLSGCRGAVIAPMIVIATRGGGVRGQVSILDIGKI